MVVDLNQPPDDPDGEPRHDLNQVEQDQEDAHGGDGLQPGQGEQEASHYLNEEVAHGGVYVQQGVIQGGQRDRHANQFVHALDLNFPAAARQHELNQGIAEEMYYGFDQMEYDWHEYGVYANEVNIVYDEDEALDAVQDDANQSGRRKDLTARERQDIYEQLLEMSHRGALKKGSTNAVADTFHVHPRSVQRIWKRAKQCRADGVSVDVSSRKAGNCGPKKIPVDLSNVATIPLLERSTIRSLANVMGLSKSTVHRCFKEGQLRRHSNTLKPYLKEANKIERLRWCVRMLDQSSLPHDPKFIEMKNIIHTDEKWFNATKKDRNFYLLPDEEDPYRTVQNKNAMEKCMLLCGVGLPWFDDEGNCIFDGKIGIWPFVRKEPAQRASQNRPRGTLITKTIKVDRNTSRQFLISKLLPAIKAKWPRHARHETIWIQQDNAKSHVPPDDEQFNIAACQTGLDIRLLNQPPNSPDMNCLDLGFFASLQSLAYKRTSRNMDELIENVQKEFNDYDPCTLRRVFLTLQGCMIEVIKSSGGNRYKIPHMSKEKLEALGMLPKSLSCDRQLYERAVQMLSAPPT